MGSGAMGNPLFSKLLFLALGGGVAGLGLLPWRRHFLTRYRCWPNPSWAAVGWAGLLWSLFLLNGLLVSILLIICTDDRNTATAYARNFLLRTPGDRFLAPHDQSNRASSRVAGNPPLFETFFCRPHQIPVSDQQPDFSRPASTRHRRLLGEVIPGAEYAIVVGRASDRRRLLGSAPRQPEARGREKVRSRDTAPPAFPPSSPASSSP